MLVNALRNSPDFLDCLSMVCEIDSQIVGYILFTKIKIVNQKNSYDSLALAPVCVLPEYQNRSIGSLLIKQGHLRAKKMGFNSVVVLGHWQYYPRFGYKKTSDFGITMPFDVPAQNCMIIELTPGGLTNVSGEVSYPKEFFE